MVLWETKENGYTMETTVRKCHRETTTDIFQRTIQTKLISSDNSGN